MVGIQIKGWEKYTVRRDIKRHSWFRVDNDILHSQTLFGLADDQKWLWIVFISLASKESHLRNGCFKIKLEWLKAQCSMPINRLEDTIKEFWERGMISILSDEEYIHVTDTNARVRIRALHYTTLHYTTDTTNTTNTTPVFDFNGIYQKYPKKAGKSVGLKKCKAQIKTQKDYELLEKAVDNYVERCKRESLDPKYIMYFSTFMTSWRDHLDEDAGTCSLQKSEADEIEELISDLR